MQLLPSVSLNPLCWNSERRVFENRADPDTIAKIFVDEEMQVLWERGVMVDIDWQRARDAVKTGERGFPPDIVDKAKVNIAECSVAADGVLRGRENRIWVPNYEPLRAAIMQRTHDSHLTGHPGRDSMISIILRRWFWPKMRESVVEI